MSILIPILVLTGVGVVAGLALAFFSRVFYVPEDPRVDQLEEALPGANCGACGFAGCRDYAKGLVARNGDVPPCPVGGQATAEKVAAILGIAVSEVEEKVALVRCAGTRERAAARGSMVGVRDCAAAALLGGPKSCRFGCMGFGDCGTVCPTKAITVYGGGVAVVDPALCIGCGLCVSKCPIDCIEMVPKGRRVHVLCNSRDPALVTRAACKVGCIACNLCTKKDPSFVVTSNVAAFTGTTCDPEFCFACPNDVIVHTDHYEVLAFIESEEARTDYEAEKNGFKEKEKAARAAARPAREPKNAGGQP
ncbi:RnfABCDGE type electron transport complex subunit B [Myxococcota bacterium]|nr:RnfABCDGE type electron transport complex subunit B [Myxococcota bacterium]MBU1413127.1 RnfABCDGE type electron transport complex subunit B [Myxococcota bacterium]MBU1512356.1 RnfABCDGE type electron transport complex subunit B [Myxococcota bacterium]